MQTKFPYYVVPVHTDDDYTDKPTHCAFEARPSAALRVAWYLAITRLLMRASKCSETRFRFPNIRWMTVKDASEWFESWVKDGCYDDSGLMDEDRINALFNGDEGGLLGYEIQVFRYGYVRLLCYGKHSGIDFYSDEISFRDLLRGLRAEHFLAEAVERCAFLRNAQVLLARLA